MKAFGVYAYQTDPCECSELLTHLSIACDSIHIQFESSTKHVSCDWRCARARSFVEHKVLLSCHNGTSLAPISIWISFHFIHVASTKHSECVCAQRHNHTHTHASYISWEKNGRKRKGTTMKAEIVNSLQRTQRLLNIVINCVIEM